MLFGDPLGAVIQPTPRRVGDLRSNQMAWSGDHDTTPASKTRKRYLSFFSRFPSISKSCFWPPNSAAPVPLSLSPSIVRV